MTRRELFEKACLAGLAIPHIVLPEGMDGTITDKPLYQGQTGISGMMHFYARMNFSEQALQAVIQNEPRHHGKKAAEDKVTMIMALYDKEAEGMRKDFEQMIRAKIANSLLTKPVMEGFVPEG